MPIRRPRKLAQAGDAAGLGHARQSQIESVGQQPRHQDAAVGGGLAGAQMGEAGREQRPSRHLGQQVGDADAWQHGVEAGGEGLGFRRGRFLDRRDLQHALVDRHTCQLPSLARRSTAALCPLICTFHTVRAFWSALTNADAARPIAHADVGDRQGRHLADTQPGLKHDLHQRIVPRRQAVGRGAGRTQQSMGLDVGQANRLTIPHGAHRPDVAGGVGAERAGSARPPAAVCWTVPCQARKCRSARTDIP